MNTLILLATLAMGDGRTLAFYDRSANCQYPWLSGAVVNSANYRLIDLCWRVSPSDGRIITTFKSNLRVENLDWTKAGKEYLRKVTK